MVCAMGCIMGLAPAAARPAAQGQASPTQYLLKPARVFDGTRMREGAVVHVRAERIVAIGTAAEVAAPGAEVIDLPGMTLMPGLIDAHSHVLLHPYNEAPWNNQVLNEALSLRVARAVNHLKATLDAGFTTLRDLGTEGAGYADVGLKQAVTQGIIPGPRLLIATRALVATGSYAPKGFAPERSGSRPAARHSTGRSRAIWCRARWSTPRSCTGSPKRWPRSATACSSSPRST